MIVISYLAIYIIWGSTYFFIAAAVETIPPSWLMAIRWSLGGILFLVLYLFQRGNKSKISIKNILSSVLVGFLLLIGGNGLVTIAEKTVDSYIAALIISTIPLVVSLLNYILYKTKISFLQILGIIIGFTGVALLLYNGDSSTIHISRGMILIFIGIFSWAIGTTIGARLPVPKNILFNSSIQMLTAGFFSFIIAFSTTDNIQTVFTSFSVKSLMSLIYLIIFGPIAIGAYNYLMRKEPAVRLTSYALVNPVIATLLGILIGGEEIRNLLFVGLPLIILGLAILIYGEKLRKKYFKGKTYENN